MLFLDRSSPLGRLERTPMGGYIAPAKVARVGCMKYLAKDWRARGVDVPARFADSDLITMYMPAEVLAAAADSMRHATVTDEHPPELVTPATFAQYAAGHVVSDSVTFDGTYLSAKLVISKQDLILSVDARTKTEVSMGYMSSFRFEDGVSPTGEAYHAVRTAVEFNHAAVVPRGRAGDKVCLALDALECVETQDAQEQVQMIYVVDGAEVAADKVQAAVLKLVAERDAQALKAEASASEVDSLKTELKAAQDALVVATSKETMDAAVAVELTARDAAKAAAERKAKVAARFPKLVLDNRTQDAIDALFDSIAEQDAADPHGTSQLDPKVTIERVVVKDAVVKPSGRAAMLASYKELDSAVDVG